MKYLFAVNTMNVGGAETGLVELMNTLVTENEVDLFLTYKTGPLLKKLDPNINVLCFVDRNRPIHSLLGLGYFTLTLFGSSVGYNRRIRRNYDIEISYLEGFPALLISRSNKESVKIASIRVELDKHRTILDTLPWGGGIQNKMYTKFDGVHCVSLATKESFDNRFTDSKSKSYVITTGFSLSEIMNKSLEGSPFENNNRINILSVGRMEQQKGYDKIFEAMKILNDDSEITFHIVGNAETKYAKDLFSKYSELLEANKIVIHGQKSNPYKYIKNADLIISTSNKEGFPRVVNESLILEKKVAATDIPSNREALNNGTYGLLFENSTEGLLKVLRNFEENRDSVLQSKVYVKDLENFKNEFVEKILEIKGDN